MSKAKRTIIEVQGSAITVASQGGSDFISLTDIARYCNSQEPFAVINNWMRSRSTIEFLGLWEKLCNPGFKPLEFERFRNEAGSNYFVLSRKPQLRPHPPRASSTGTLDQTQRNRHHPDANTTGGYQPETTEMMVGIITLTASHRSGFQPSNPFREPYLGRCPRLVWGRAFGPLEKMPAPALSTFALSSAPTAQHHTSPGQRPGSTAPTFPSLEGATHLPHP